MKKTQGVRTLNDWEERTMWWVWSLFALVGVLRVVAFLVEEERQKSRGVQSPIWRHLSALDFHQPLKTSLSSKR